ncbi:MAG: hypothetical protein LUF30_04385 [Lachnospiraceae bacterium]|nr:hypothetical protein [Lachnospiraceae bacterium]
MKLKSTLIRMENLEDAIRKWSWNVQIGEAKVQENLYQAALPYANYVDADTIQAGDILTVEMKSTLPRYNRTLKLNVGSGMFDLALEAGLPGKHTGEEYHYTLTQSESASQMVVTYHILEIRRLVVPEVNDEIARAQKIPDVQTAAELRRYYEIESVRDMVSQQSADFLDTYCGSCEFSIDAGEIQAMDAAELERCREIARNMGKDFDQMQGYEMQSAVGCENVEAFKIVIHDMHIRNLKLALIAAQFTGEDFTLEAGTIYEQIDKLREKVLRAVTADFFNPLT